MFQFLTVLFAWSLLTFGAVLPHAHLLLALTWLVVLSLYLVISIASRRHVDLLLIGCWSGGALSMVLFGPKLGILILAFLWSWRAAQTQTHSTLRFFYVILGIGVLEALMGLFQYFVAPGWIFGYENISGSMVSGTLINRNHFAGLLEMIIPISIGMAFIAVRRYQDSARSYVYVLAGAIIAIALVFSLSRMGVFSFLTSLLFVMVLFQLRKSERRLASTLGFGLAGLFLAGTIWIGIDTIVDRYADLFKDDSLAMEGRGAVFRDTLRMIKDHPGGLGIDRYRDAFRQYQTIQLDSLFDHAHNDYLETLAEWGVFPAATVWLIVGSIFAFACKVFLFGSRSVEQQGILLICIGSIFSILIHSLADFNLQIPSNGLLFLTFVGIALGTLVAPDSHSDSSPT